MAFNIDFNALSRGADIGQSWQAGVQQGQARALDNRKQSVLAAIGANPRDPAAQSALFGIDPSLALQVQKGNRDQDVAAREASARSVYSQFLRQSSVLGAPAASGGSALSPPPIANVTGIAPDYRNGDEVVVEASRPQPRVSIADVAELDPEMAQRLTTHVASLDESGRKAFEARNKAMGAAAQHLRSIPASARVAAIDGLAPLLEQSGISRQEIEAADLSDAGLSGYVALAVGAEKLIDDARQDRSTNATIANQAARLGLARNADARGARADRRAAVRFNERDKDRAAIASSGGGVRTDLSDLDY
jgi:hypothetical protein